MRLAASQRPQPPPVPPRPSRQVVAEALKRSPRPPCPTRQAPPPPNTKPWRPQDLENVPDASGRTIIYESAKPVLNMESDDAQGGKGADDATLTTNLESTVKPQDLRLNRVLGERNAVNSGHHNRDPTRNKRLQLDPRKIRYDQIRGIGKTLDLEKREAFGGVLKEAKALDPRSTDQRLFQGVQSCNGRPPKDGAGDPLDFPDDIDPSEYENVGAERLSLVGNEAGVAESPPCVPPCSNAKPPVPRRPSLSNSRASRKDDDSLGSDADANGESSHQGPATRSSAEEEQPVKASALNGDATDKSISGDDRATVVVIDEPERKVMFEDSVNIHHQDWLEAGIRYSSTQITLPGDDFSEQVNGFDYLEEEFNVLDFSSIREKIAMSSLQGLPPLPRSLSGFNLSTARDGGEPPPPPARSSSRSQRGTRATQVGTRPSPPGRQLTTLDTQLAVLRREMFGLRQLDLSLLSQLWSLNESIQDFRQLLQEQEDRAPSPSPSSEEGDDTSYGTHPPPPPRRPPPVALQHRLIRLPSRDDSPSSEEYGAV